MNRLLRIAVFAITLPAAAQMHKVAKPEQVVRAIGVYEWTGDFNKPNASRLIPVSLFIDNHFEDAGVYVARPVPFALLSGNVYILQSAGSDKAALDLVFARHLEATTATGDSAYDDGWFGYGKVKPLAVPKPPKALHASKTTPALTSSKPDTAAVEDPDRPTMKRRNPDSGTASPSTTGTASGTSTGTTQTTQTDDPDRPTMKRRDTTADSTTPSTASTNDPAFDPDRPTMKRHDSSSDTTADANTDTTSSANDPDRPTLKRHTAADAAKAATNDLAYNSDALNNDPDRPNLHRGKPTASLTETELPRLTGRPSSLHQMVAVSDAANRTPHSFTLTFDDAEQHTAILTKMQALARAQLAAYTTPAGAPAMKTIKTASRPVTRSTTAKKPSTPQTVLLDEDLKAYMLSYGGDPTYIYSANTGGTGADLRFVTIVAQTDSIGELKPAIQNVTDASHLDRTPAMHFVDVVDAEASNRASLVFELRSQNARQFALYRVIASHAEQIFTTGTTQ